MYVRISVDVEDATNPRDFIYGKIESVNTFTESCKVIIYDLHDIRKYYSFNETMTVPVSTLTRADASEGVKVEYGNETCVVLAKLKRQEEDYSYYYVKSDRTDSIFKVCEKDLKVSFVDCEVSPVTQLLNYEFQHPTWYVGRYAVNRTVKQIETACYGFKTLSGNKVFLKPHQLKTVMRCVQGDYIRNMIADEVGMGKTIEAAMVLKLYMENNHNKKICIVVPDSLVEQWRTELAFKFSLFEGSNINGNKIELIPLSRIEILSSPLKLYDFLLIDEVHRLLNDNALYKTGILASKKTRNVLMLSATPVQKREEEYYRLLKLIQPEKYDSISEPEFNKLLTIQKSIMRDVFNVFSDLGEYEECISDSENKHTDDTEDLFEEIYDSLEKLGHKVNNSVFSKMITAIDYNSENFGVPRIKTSLAYLCENYQLEKCIIRNRRNLDTVRELVEIGYKIDDDFNNSEYRTYSAFSEWFEECRPDYEEFNLYFKGALSALFSSSFAFEKALKSFGKKYAVPLNLKKTVSEWCDDDKRNLKRISRLLDDPVANKSRMVSVIDFIDQETEGKKVLVFTDFESTFDYYREAFLSYFGEEKCCFFKNGMSRDELELNVYRFQNFDNYQVLLSDSTGGEGRNFQNADFIIHIDLPWSANSIEQRIGRLDRIGRDPDKPVVSVVAYAGNSLDGDLFRFWNEGVGIFTQSQTGLEIIMNDIDRKISEAVCSDIKYGLSSEINSVNSMVSELKETVKHERHFDLNAYKYQIINLQLERVVENYTESETELFGKAMMSWASLVGFKGTRINDNIVQFNDTTFSVGSANKALLVPPDMDQVINDKMNVMRNHIRELNHEKLISSNGKYIRGTFSRIKAVENDYIHFFAPGDQIFDAITENAMRSYRGRSAAYSCLSDINWVGLMFTWSVKPDIKVLIENNVPLNMAERFSSFLFGGLINIPYSISNPDDLDDKTIKKYFVSSIRKDGAFAKTNYEHLGSRSFHKNNIGGKLGVSNADWFKRSYPREQWQAMVREATKMSKEKLKNEIVKKSNIRGLKSELQNILSTDEATSVFYGHRNKSEDKFYSVILEAFLNPEYVLESVGYIRMSRNG